MHTLIRSANIGMGSERGAEYRMSAPERTMPCRARASPHARMHSSPHACSCRAPPHSCTNVVARVHVRKDDDLHARVFACTVVCMVCFVACFITCFITCFVTCFVCFVCFVCRVYVVFRSFLKTRFTWCVLAVSVSSCNTTCDMP